MKYLISSKNKENISSFLSKDTCIGIVEKLCENKEIYTNIEVTFLIINTDKNSRMDLKQTLFAGDERFNKFVINNILNNGYKIYDIKLNEI